ncbi:MAG: copper resistance protein CopC [Dehalococcoidia bacterium]
MTRSRRTPLAALALVGLLLAMVVAARAPRAEAHAILVRSSPAAQATLLDAPGVIDLWFSEPLEDRFSTFDLLASDGSTVPVDGIRVDPTDETHLSGLPRALEPGLYTVVYRNLSQLDGHEWSGSFAFTILNPDGSTPAGTAFDPGIDAASSPAEVVGRWFAFLGLALPLGGGLLALFAVRASSRDRSSTRPSRLTRTVHRTAIGLGLAAVPLLAAAGPLLLQAQVEAVDAAVLDVVSETRFGTYWLWRQLAALGVAVALALALLAHRRGRDRSASVLLGAAALAAAGGLVATSLVSHAAAAPGRGWALLIDVAHIELAAAWVGGLVVLAALFVRLRTTEVPRRVEAVLHIVGPFSTFAAASLYVLAVTGVLRSLGELTTADLLVSTAYGRWLLVKLALLTPILGIALANRRTLHAAETHADDSYAIEAATRLRRLLPLEAALAVAVLAAVAVLGQTPTPRDPEVTAQAAAAVPYNRIETVGELAVHLQVTPATVGENELRVHVYRSDAADIGPIDRVLLTFAGGEGGGDRVEPASEGDGIYVTSGSFLSLARTWDVRVDVQRPNVDDARFDFEVPVGSGTASAATADRFGTIAPQIPVANVWAVVALAGGIALLLRARTPGNNENLLRLGGAAGVFVAIWLVVSAEQHRDAGVFPSNPYPVTSEALDRGEAIYVENCAACHGLSGAGDGPAAAGLDPRPADLRAHVPFHPEGETFLFVSEGFPNTAMPAWKDQLTEEQRWDVVEFLRASFDE